jgi:hypothetical protein
MILWIAVSIAVVLVIAAVAAGPVMSNVEQPKFDIVERSGAIELRAYAPMIAAETAVRGERKPAIEEGFRRIADYIFGGNKPRAKIAMTAPVVQEAKEKAAQKIAMTAPVVQQLQGDRSWTVSFIMPSEWTMQTLPEPNDGRVKLVEIPARRMLSIVFSGTATDDLIQAKIAELRRYAESKQMKVSGDPVLAFYNPPWTLPPLRRNEVMLLVER